MHSKDFLCVVNLLDSILSFYGFHLNAQNSHPRENCTGKVEFALLYLGWPVLVDLNKDVNKSVIG